MQAHRLPPKEWRKEPELLLTSAAQRRACFARDGSKCCDCGQVTPTWQAEHDVALHAIPPSMGFPAALQYWRIGNLRTRCVKCHSIKSGCETKTRAKIKRLIKKANGIENKWKKKVTCRLLPQKKKHKFVSRHKPVISWLKFRS